MALEQKRRHKKIKTDQSQLNHSHRLVLKQYCRYKNIRTNVLNGKILAYIHVAGEKGYTRVYLAKTNCNNFEFSAYQRPGSLVPDALNFKRFFPGHNDRFQDLTGKISFPFGTWFFLARAWIDL